MQSAKVDTNDIIIEYITDAQGNKVKKLKPLLIKKEPVREYIQHIHSDNNLPNVPENNFIQKREVIIDSYSETISSDSSCDDRTITADSDSSASSFEETSCTWEADSKGIEAYTTLDSLLITKCCRRLPDLCFPYIKNSPIQTSSSNCTNNPTSYEYPYTH